MSTSKKNKKEKIIIKYLASVTPLDSFRKTPEVNFLKLDDVIKKVKAVNYIFHEPGAKSPQIDNNKGLFWYMHTRQKDNLIVHCGYRIVELYSKRHGKKEIFEISKDYVKLNGKIIHHGPAILSWPPLVFHRISSPEGSISTNYAYHYQQFSRKNNFNIYDLDISNGNYRVIRQASLDEK
jgi:hypothetical protein